MHFLFVTYRWGNDLVGGAELFHRRLAQELIDEGHRVSVMTSTGHQVSTFWHWAVKWVDVPVGDAAGDIPVTRLPRKQYNKYAVAAGAKLLQLAMEREDASVPADLRHELVSHLNKWGVHLLNGWHYPEVHEGATRRWTQKNSWMYVDATDAELSYLHLTGIANNNRLRLYNGKDLLAEKQCHGGTFRFSAVLPPQFKGMVRLETERIARFRRDHRSMGVWMESIELHGGGHPPAPADFANDYRALGRAHPEAWQRHLFSRAAGRSPKLNALFDRLRGPVMKGLSKAIGDAGADHVIHCNMPWGNFSAVRPGDLAMPFMHVDDEYYYWQQWIDALRRARLVLAIAPYSADKIFPQVGGINAVFVGPPIWQPEVAIPEEEKKDFRRKHNVAEDECLVLTVCRKSEQKRYDSIAEAVVQLRREGRRVRMIGVGPDVDLLPFSYDGCEWIGKLPDHDLQVAYASCDVFAFMSESESFGMVVPEAWHHGKPVIVNRMCGAAASILHEGVDGLLATPGRELVEAIRELADDIPRAHALGEEGRKKALRDYVRGAAARRLLEGLKNEGQALR